MNAEDSICNDLLPCLCQALQNGGLTPDARDALTSIGSENPQETFRSIFSMWESPISRDDFEALLSDLIRRLAGTLNLDRAFNFLDRFGACFSNRASFYRFLHKVPNVLNLLCHIFSASRSLSETLIRNPEFLDWFSEEGILDRDWDSGDLKREIESVMETFQRWTPSLKALRRFRRRMILRIGARDLMNLSTLENTVRELSQLADVCMDFALKLSLREAVRKFGEPRSEWDSSKRADLTVIGLGKLGGLELNYSSDIDLMMCYSEEGETTGGELGKLDNHGFYTKVAESFIKVLSASTEEGYLYRVDLRLRPEGNAGPLVRSLDSFENYYASWGQSWERQALIKARCVAGSAVLGQEFIRRISPFIYRKYLDFKAIDDMRLIKKEIESRVKARDEEELNIKLGIGGLRDVEFGLQILQLLYGGKMIFLRQANTLLGLDALVAAGFAAPEEILPLKEGYIFLRKIENLLQMDMERQTHVLPEDPKRRAFLAQVLGFSDIHLFQTQLKSHRNTLQSFYSKIFRDLSALSVSDQHEVPLMYLWASGELNLKDEDLLRNTGFKNLDAARRGLLSLARGGEGLREGKITDDFLEILPGLLEAMKSSCRPDYVLLGLVRFLSSYLARRSFFSLLKSKASLMEFLVKVLGTSPLLTDLLVKRPELFDVLVSGALENHGLDEAEFRKVHKIIKWGPGDGKEALSLLIQYKDYEMLRLGVLNVLGLSELEEMSCGLTILAERCVQSSLTISRSVFRKQHGKQYPPFVVLGLGKLGAHQMGFASDLDLMFVTDGGLKSLHDANEWGAQLMEILSAHHESGFLYQVDPRLRPEGSKGPLVYSLEGCEKYYASTSAFWERMALSRARFIAGNQALGEKVLQIIRRFVYQAKPIKKDVREILDLRERIVAERCSGHEEGLDLKSGVGGLLDIEFLVQFLRIKHDRALRNRKETHTIRLLQKLTEKKFLKNTDGAYLLKGYLELRKIENKLRMMKERSEDFIAKDDAILQIIEEKSIDHWMKLMKGIRKIYEKYFRM